jgi:hypothetical protein
MRSITLLGAGAVAFILVISQTAVTGLSYADGQTTSLQVVNRQIKSDRESVGQNAIAPIKNPKPPSTPATKRRPPVGCEQPFSSIVSLPAVQASRCLT